MINRFVKLSSEKGAAYAFNLVFTRLQQRLRSLLRKLLAPRGIFIDRYQYEANAEVNLYQTPGISQSKYASYRPQKDLVISPDWVRNVRVSLIATLRNEAGNVEDWGRSVFAQTRLPDEIIITDAGSTDGTLELLQRLAKQSPVPFRILQENGANIARGRNQAIRAAQYEIIAATDFGCRLDRNWLDRIVGPFEIDPLTQVAAGMYRALDRHGKVLDRTAWWSSTDYIDPLEFLPSSRSVAFTRSIWETVGGYPEWLMMTGEDTYFALELRKYSQVWAFVPEAMVEWHAPSSTFDYWKKIYAWSIGDGESGIKASLYWRQLLQSAFQLGLTIAFLGITIGLWAWKGFSTTAIWMSVFLVIWLAGLLLITRGLKIRFQDVPQRAGGSIAKILGFIHGARRRQAVDLQRRELLKGTVFILSGVPIDDTGGGARCTQLAREFLRQKYAVVYINKYPRYESVDLRISIHDQHLYTYQLAQLDWTRFCQEQGWLLDLKPLAALVEMPLPDFLPLIKNIQSQGGAIIYDLLDDWQTTLGGSWYSEDVEARVIDASRILLATAPALAERLGKLSGREVVLFPNAANTLLFNPDRFYQRPADLPPANKMLIYTGALWGEWFDWDLLVATAKAFAEAAVVVIGDYRGQVAQKPPNLFFLGLKPQESLPAYLAYADAAIVPWKINRITQATSPLKVYEYLAMRLPVIAPEINPLRGIPGVYLAKDTKEFVQLAGEVGRSSLPVEDAGRFIQENTWQARVNCLNKMIEQVQGARRM